MRAGHYLCFFGIHVLTPTVMELLGRKLAERAAQIRRRFPPPWPNWPGTSSTWRWKTPAGATISAPATAC